MIQNLLCLCLFLIHATLFSHGTPVSSVNWEISEGDDGVKFSGRNAHASCVFKGEIWLTGGKTAEYVTWNLQDSYQVGDVWHSVDGVFWKQVTQLAGDFFAQNTDVVQPGSIAPWYQRYGHSLDAVDIDGDGEEDIMVLMGGYSPSPSNDIWITTDGVYWVYCGLAPWSKRAWHSTVIFQNKLWMMGGTPLNNEVWSLESVSTVSRRAPLTRSTYANYTYALEWKQYPDAPWQPRVGAGVVSQWYFNTSSGETLADSKQRIVLAGGYGGYPPVEPNVAKYDGFVTRPDTWETYNGRDWRQLNWNNTFGGRAWMGMEVMHDVDPRIHFPPSNTSQPPKMYIFGGGFIGFRTNSKKRVNTMQGKADGYYSQDGEVWVKINYEEGGGTTTVPFFSSQEWTQTVVDTQNKYIGRWGLTLHDFNPTTGKKAAGPLFLLAGDFTAGGEYANSVYKSQGGIFCDIEGVICGGHGTCGTTGCVCDKGYTGVYCVTGTGPVKGNGAAGGRRQRVRVAAGLAGGLAAAVLLL